MKDGSSELEGKLEGFIKLDGVRDGQGDGCDGSL